MWSDYCSELNGLVSERPYRSSPRKPSAGYSHQVEIEKVVDGYLEVPDSYGCHEGGHQNRIERVEKEIQRMPLYLGGALYVLSELQVGTHAYPPTIGYFTCKMSVCIPNTPVAQFRISGEASPDFRIDIASLDKSGGGFVLKTV